MKHIIYSSSKDKLTNRSSGRGLGRLFGLGLIFSALSSRGTGSASASSSLALGSVASVFSADAFALVLDDVLVLSLFVLSEW